MRQLLIATANEGKFLEIGEALRGLPLTLLSLRDVAGFGGLPVEEGRSFEENAVKKATFALDRTGLPSLTDDSGIIVEALKDELGIHTRRWGAGPEASDEEWIEYFLKRMKREENKKATFVCVLAMATHQGVRTFEGQCSGVITDRLEAPYLPGLPLSACFRPNGHSCVFSALKIEQKNCTSHRGRALIQLREFLESSFISSTSTRTRRATPR